MLEALTILLGCQLAGELVARLAHLPVPGPVIGMVILFVALKLRGGPPDWLSGTAKGLLAHLSLLFVPAGVGVMIHAERIGTEWLALGAALIGSTLLTLAAAAVTFMLVSRLIGDRSADADTGVGNDP